MSEHVNNENERSVDMVDGRLIFRYTYIYYYVSKICWDHAEKK